MNINWEAIGCLAEGLGAVGVIATVIYVALRIRHSAEAVRSSTEHALISQEMSLAALIAEHANIYRRGKKKIDELDADEVVVFEQLVIASMALLYSAFAQYKRGLVPESTWHAYLSDWPKLINQPGFREQWIQLQTLYPPEFIDSLDSAATITGYAVREVYLQPHLNVRVIYFVTSTNISTSLPPFSFAVTV
jgi:hypothetical protein